MRGVTLHIVRHGETTWNLERRLQGQTQDVPLTERGREQAHEIAGVLAATAAGAIVSSDLDRALETARIIGRRLGLTVTTDPALRELHFGTAQGRRAEDIEELARIRTEPDLRFERGESIRDVYRRAAAFIEGLRTAAPAREVIAVTHGGTMNVLLACLAGARVESMTWERLENCALRTVSLRAPAR